MLYELGYRTGIAIGAEVESLEFTAVTSALAPETLSVDRGGLLVNGIDSGSSADVVAGDKVRIYVNASNSGGLPLYVNLTQNGNFAGSFVVLTAPDDGSVFDSRYKQLEPYEVLPDSTWTPAPDREVLVIDESDLSIQSTIAVTDSPLQSVPKYRIHINDYHRDLTYVLDGVNGSFQGVVPTNLLGPVSDATIFNASGQRIGQAIAYRKSNKVAITDSFYGLISEIDSTDPIKVESNNNVLYLLEKGSSQVRVFTFDDALGHVETQVSFSGPVLDFIASDGQVAAIVGDVFIDFNGREYAPMAAKGYKLYFEPETQNVVVLHGLEDTRLTYYRGSVGSRSVSTKRSSSFKYPTYANQRITGSESPVYVDDISHKLYYQNAFHANSDLKDGGSLPGPAYGITSLGSLLFVPNLYQDIDEKLTSNDTKVDPIDFGEKQLGLIGQSIESDEVTVTGINTETKVYIPGEYQQTLQLVVNGSVKPDTVKSATINNGDTLKIRVTSIKEMGEADSIPIVVGEDIFEFRILPAEPFILPHNTTFKPLVAAGPNVEVCGAAFTIVGLGDGESINVSTDNGLLKLNGDTDGMATAHSVKDGDTLTVCLTSGPNACDVVSARITYGNRFTTVFSVVTPEAVDPNAVTLDHGVYDPLDIGELVLNVGLGAPVVSNESTVVIYDQQASVSVSIPDIYDSYLIINGVNVGHSGSVSHGDTIAVGMTTTYNYYTDHIIPIRFCNNVYDIIFKTVPDYVPDNFYFGFQDGLHIAQRVLSDKVTITGLMSGARVPMVVPYGTVPIINDVPLSIPPHLLDYRGVLKEDFTTTITNNDSIQLDGYPRPHYGSLKAIDVVIGYRTGTWELGTFALEEGANRNKLSRAELDGPGAVRSFMRQPVLVEPEKKTFGLSTSTRPVKSTTVRPSTVVVDATVSVPNGSSVVNSAKTVRSETQIKAVVLETSLRTAPSGTAVPEPNTSLAAFGNNEASEAYVAQHPEKFPSLNWVQHETSTQHGFDVMEGYVEPAREAVESQLPRNDYLAWPNEYREFDNPPSWKKDELRAPVKGVVLQKSGIVYEQKEFVTTPSHFAVRPRNVPVTWSVDFKDNGIADHNLMAPVDWIELENYVEYKMTTPPAKVWDPDVQNKFDGNYFVAGRNARVTFAPVGIKDQLRTEDVKGAKIFKRNETNETNYFDIGFVKSTSSSTVTFEASSAVFASAPIATVKGSSVVMPPRQDVLMAATAVVKAPAPTPVFISAQPDVVYSNTSESHLAGTFATEEDAEADALSRGLEAGAFQIVPYEDRFIWIRDIACANMCYDCPPAGYIQGG